jgi:L-rhamnose mutarotase
MPRYCLLGHVDPNRLEEYREAHRAVWPELLEALRDAGWRNYSLFLRDDGLLIGYAEADDLAVAQEQVARTEVNCSRPRALLMKPGRSSRKCSTSKIKFTLPVGPPDPATESVVSHV